MPRWMTRSNSPPAPRAEPLVESLVLLYVDAHMLVQRMGRVVTLSAGSCFSARRREAAVLST